MATERLPRCGWRSCAAWLLMLLTMAAPNRHFQLRCGFWSPWLAAANASPVVAPKTAPTADPGSSGSLHSNHEEQQLSFGGGRKCPGSCALYGTCNEELGSCDCPRDRDGPDCSVQLVRRALLRRCKSQGYTSVKECLESDQSCVNGCNRRGKCDAGFCHCKPGHYGTDCSLSLGPDGKPVLLSRDGYTPREKRPWVYMYELPPKLSAWYNFKRLDRPLHLYLWQRLLSSGARVADGDLADYYLIPVRQRCFSDSVVLREAIEHIQQHYPWWNRTGGGHRHVIVQTGDWGRGEVDVDVRAMTWNATWLTHWGLTTKRPIIRWTPAFRPDKDVVIPVYISPGHFVKFGMTRSPLNPSVRVRGRNASTLFFAGRICHDAKRPDAATFPRCGDDTADWYGGGIREKVFVAHWNRTGFRITRSEPRYGHYLSHSAYCLAPPGAGHGQRQIQALFMGCSPVTVGDDIAEPFEPAVSWQDWGVRVAEADIPRMHEILAAVTPEEMEAKRARMHCAAQHMLYSSITGAILGEDGRYDAFETMLEVLRVRAAHPDAPQEDFRRLDPDFDAFMSCKPPPGFKWLSGLPAAGSTDDEGEDGEGDGEEGSGGEQEQARKEEGGEGASGGAPGIGGGGKDGSGSEDGGGPGDGGGLIRSPAPAASGKQPSVLCSHSTVDMHHRERTCYYFLRGSGYMGVPGGAICARGHRYRLAACPRLWG